MENNRVINSGGNKYFYMIDYNQVINKDFEKCVNKTLINGEFGQITEPVYRFNKRHNSCWGKKVAITRDGKVRPYIYSTIKVTYRAFFIFLKSRKLSHFQK